MSEKKEIKISAAKGRPMLSWVGKRPLRHVTAFPAQHMETFAPVENVGAAPSGRPSSIDKGDNAGGADMGAHMGAPLLSDVPEKKNDLIDGSYSLLAPADKTTVAVKISDMLGEEVLIMETV
ncbi:MAG: hypothetical protein WC156_15600 [Pedobacter sp.]